MMSNSPDNDYYYVRQDSETVRQMTHGRRTDDGYIGVDLPGLRGVFAFKRGALTALVGNSGVGKTVLADNLVANAAEVLYLPLQSTSLEAARERLSALDAGIGHFAAITERSMRDRIALKEADERMLVGKTVVCTDNVVPDCLNEILVGVFGESDEFPSTIEGSKSALVVLDNIDMIEGHYSLRERVQMLKDEVKNSGVALLAVVSADYDDPAIRNALSNADEIYSLEQVLVRVPASTHLQTPVSPKSKTVRVCHAKCTRFDGHALVTELEIDLCTRAVCGAAGSVASPNQS